ncbi:MAG: PQQ-binding-like beta-propeller repeat protein, partial [Planctomycetota bacterium]
MAGKEVGRGRPGPDDSFFGPYYGSEPLPAAGLNNDLPTLGGESVGQQWRHPAAWRVLGPLPQKRTRFLPDLPGAIFSTGVAWPATGGRAGGKAGPGAGDMLRWREAEPDERGTLQAPGKANSVWYAATRLRSGEERDVWLGLNVSDHAKLWLNDRLVWTDVEREWGYAEDRPAVFRVRLQKGVNRLLIRCRNDRGDSSLQVRICTQGRPGGDKAVATTDVKRPSAAGRPGNRMHRYPDAAPPLAWDLEEGTNILWRRKLSVSRSAGGVGASSGGMSISIPDELPPVCVADGKLFAASPPHTLICLDAESGEPLWRRETNVLSLQEEGTAEAWDQADSDADRLAMLSEAGAVGRRTRSLSDIPAVPPVSDGRNVYVHYGTGVTACYGLDGTRRWVVRTRVGKGSLLLGRGRIVLTGRPLAGWSTDGKARGRHAAVALDAGTGERLWKKTLEGEYPGRPFLLPLREGPQSREVLLTRSWQAFDAADGGELTCDVRPGQWDWNGTWQQGGMLYSTFEGGRAAVRLWFNDAGHLGSRQLWHGRRLHAFTAGGPGGTIVGADRLFAYRLVPEHAKHCPAYALSLEYFDRETGAPLGRLNPVLRGSNHRMAPVLAGRYLFLSDSRGGPHSGGTPAERQIHVVDVSSKPIVVARNDVPHLRANPVFAGDRMYLVRGDEIVCVAARGESGRSYQDRHVARTFFEGIYDEPEVPELPKLAPSPVPECETPVVSLESGKTITGWLTAGPFPDDPNAGLPAGLESGKPAPEVGDALEVDEVSRTWTPLGRGLIQSRTGFHNDGRLDDWQLRTTRRLIDVRPLTNGPGELAWLYTTLSVSRAGLIRSTMDAPGLEAWLGGRKLRPSRPVRVGPGLYPLAVLVRPEYFQPEHPQQPVDVAKALKAGALTDIHWPRQWRVFGPIPQAAGAVAPKQFASTPKTLSVGGEEVTGHRISCIGPTLDLVPIVGLEPGQAPPPADEVRTSGRVPQDASAYCFAEVDCPEPGRLIINAAADWFMAVHVDGERVYDTLRSGNGRAARSLQAHTIGVDVDAGLHVVAVEVRPGSKGWSFTSLGALATGDADSLAEKFPAAGGVRVARPEFRASPSLSRLTDPRAVREIWLEQVRTHRRRLEWIVRKLPDTRKARRAKR